MHLSIVIVEIWSQRGSIAQILGFLRPRLTSNNFVMCQVIENPFGFECLCEFCRHSIISSLFYFYFLFLPNTMVIYVCHTLTYIYWKRLQCFRFGSLTPAFTGEKKNLYIRFLRSQTTSPWVIKKSWTRWKAILL